MANEIRTYEIDRLSEIMNEFGQPSFRAKQLYEWFHVQNAASYDEMTNLPKQLRAELERSYPITSAEVSDRQESQDGARKYLLELDDGAVVETVGIPMDDGARLTACFSTQAGCPMKCSFCATGDEGFQRNLTSQEMIDQITAVQKDFKQRVSNLVAMGQGEPFMNYDELMKALRRANTDNGFKIGARRITISTCGIVDGIRKLADEPEQFTLAVSLHSAVQSTRNKLMPNLTSQPIDELKEALEEYLDKKHRRVTLEYLMIDGVNDTADELEALAKFCKGLLCHVNLIPLNPVEGSIYKPSPQNRIDTWIDALEADNISVTQRNSKGSDIAGACGQLKNSRLN